MSRSPARMRTTVAVLVMLLGSGLSACGDPIDGYCDTVKDNRKELNQLADADTEFGLLTHLPMLRELADAAPADITDEWQTYLDAVEGLSAAVEGSGHAPSDFADGKRPEGLSAEDKSAIATAADRLTSEETVAASQGIDQQARDVCKVNLGR